MRADSLPCEVNDLAGISDALDDLAKRIGFRTAPGLSERVIFRELFPSGLTLLDKGHLGDLGMSHITARQELREMVAGLALPLVEQREPAEQSPRETVNS